MGIKLLCVGKNKDDSLKLLIDGYIKKIGTYTNIEQDIIPDVSLTKTNNKRVVIELESDKVIKYIEKVGQSNKKTFLILLDREGVMRDSQQLAELIELKGSMNELMFIIGGVYGISTELKKRADLLLSLSPLTFTHQMSRIIILEQIYRSYTIINNKKYHY